MHAQTQRSDCRLLLDQGKLESENNFQELIEGFKKQSNLKFEEVLETMGTQNNFDSMIKRAKTSFLEGTKTS